MWIVRVIAKIILSRFPIGYRIWARFGVFRHGKMDNIKYATQILERHLPELNTKGEWRGLEIGPGDSIFSALLTPILYPLNQGITLVDSGDYASKDLKLYRSCFSSIDKNLNLDAKLPDFDNSETVEELLSSIGGCYLIDGLSSIKRLPDEQFDIIFSQAVLEHIRKDEVFDMMVECNRLLKDNGIMSHVIDFKDHLGGGLNNLRFNEGLWEKDWFAYKSGFYTNRLRLVDFEHIASEAGFRIEVRSKRLWCDLPISQKKLAPLFWGYSEDEMKVSGAHLIMKKVTLGRDEVS
jgi:SAM-dependent methyltransferase